MAVNSITINKSMLNLGGGYRYHSLDKLKVLCAFLVVCIHAPFTCVVGEYFTSIARIAVPIFFMITGFFYPDVVKQEREKKQIRKIFCLMLTGNAIYFVWRCAEHIMAEGTLILFIKNTFTLKNAVKFLIFNESPFGSHLWYMGAAFYVLLIAGWLKKTKLIRLLYIITPFLLLGDLALGKYSLLLFNREFPYIIVRNWLFVGVPYFAIGVWIAQHSDKLRDGATKKRLVITMAISSATTLLERFVLVTNGLNSTRDHYLSTTFLAISVFLLFLFRIKQNENLISRTGRRDSTWVYIIHPILIAILTAVASRLRVENEYNIVRPIIIFVVTVLMVDIMVKLMEYIKCAIK